jgi:hypothetical protein
MAAWYIVKCVLLCEPWASHVMIKQPLALPDPLRLSNFLPRLVVSGRVIRVSQVPGRRCITSDGYKVADTIK